jgi:hypothetical protein
MTGCVTAKQLMAVGYANDLPHKSLASHNVTQNKSGTEAAFVVGAGEF